MRAVHRGRGVELRQRLLDACPAALATRDSRMCSSARSGERRRPNSFTMRLQHAARLVELLGGDQRIDVVELERAVGSGCASTARASTSTPRSGVPSCSRRAAPRGARSASSSSGSVARAALSASSSASGSKRSWRSYSSASRSRSSNAVGRLLHAAPRACASPRRDRRPPGARCASRTRTGTRSLGAAGLRGCARATAPPAAGSPRSSRMRASASSARSSCSMPAQLLIGGQRALLVAAALRRPAPRRAPTARPRGWSRRSPRAAPPARTSSSNIDGSAPCARRMRSAPRAATPGARAPLAGSRAARPAGRRAPRARRARAPARAAATAAAPRSASPRARAAAAPPGRRAGRARAYSAPSAASSAGSSGASSSAL